VWNWNTGKQEAWPAAPHARTGRACSGPVGLATSGDGERIAVVTADGLLHLFSGRTLEPQGEPLETGLDPFPVCNAQIVFSPDGRWLAVSNGEFSLNGTFTGKSVGLFERTRDGWRPGPPLTGHQIRVDALAFSEDSEHLATGSPTGKEPKTDPGLIVLHDVKTGKTGKSITTINDPYLLALDWDRHRVVAGSVFKDALVYDIDSGENDRRISGLGSVVEPVYNGDWTQLAVSGNDGFRLLDADSLEQIKGPDIKSKSGSIAAVFLPHDQVLLAGDHNSMTVWDLTSTSVLQTVTEKLASVLPTARPDVFITSRSAIDGTFMTILGPVPAYQPRSPEIRVGSPQVYGPAWCADPSTNRIATVATGTPAGKGDIVVRQGAPPFDVTSRTHAVDFASPIACAWRPDGKQIAVGGWDGEVALYQVATGDVQLVDAQLRTPVISLAYRPDSTELWVTSPGSGSGAIPVRITNLDNTPHAMPALPNRGTFDALRFSPDGRFLVTVAAKKVRVLDARSLEPVTDEIPVTTNLTVSVFVSPDGHTAVITDFGGWMQLVDLRAGRAIGPPIPTGPLPGVFGRDDMTIYTTTPDGRATVWDLAPNHVRDAACALAGRNLTQAEWDRYLPWAGPRDQTCAQFPQE
jgi:WD40 repeat protein